MSEWHLNRMVLTFVREESHIFGGITMHDLDMEIRTNLHYSAPDVVKVTGNASAVFGGKWFVNITDESCKNFVISLNLIPAIVTEMRSLILIKLPFLEMDARGNTTWSYDLLENNYNCSLMVAHPLTMKLLPVFKLFIKDDLKKAQDCVYYGKMYWDANIWNPFFSAYHLNPVLNVLVNPTNNTHSDLKLNFTMGEYYYINHTMDFLNEVQLTIPVFRNVTVCVPREATGRTETRLPFLESTHHMEIEPKKYDMTSNATMLLRLPNMYVMQPIFNCTNVMKFTLTDDNRLVGVSKCNGTILRPTITPFKADMSITPVSLSNGNIVRKFGFAYQLYQEEPLTLNISAPEKNNRRRIIGRAFGNEVLTSNLEISECSLSSPILPEVLCVPREMHMEDINANLAVARILREFPFLNIIIPDTQLLNVVLRDSNISLITTKQNEENWDIICKSRLSGPSWSKRISEELARLNLPYIKRSDEDAMCTWNTDINITRTPSKIDCILDTKTNTPL